MIDTAVVSCTKVVRKYESIIRKYFRTKVTYCTFEGTFVLYSYESTFVFPEVRRSTLRISTTYVRLLLLYESTKVQLHVHVRVQLPRRYMYT